MADADADPAGAAGRVDDAKDAARTPWTRSRTWRRTSPTRSTTPSDALGGGDDEPPTTPPPATDVPSRAPSDRSSAARRASLPDPVGELRFQVADRRRRRSARSPSAPGSPSSTRSSSTRRAASNDFVHKFRGGLKYPNLVLKRGVTYEDALLKWFFDRAGPRASAGTSRSTLLGADGKPVRTLGVRGRLPGQVDGPGVQRRVDERRDRDPRDRPPGLRSAELTMPLPRHRPASSRPTSRSRATASDRLLVQPQGVHDREGEPVEGRRRSPAPPCRPRSSAAAQPRKLTLELLFDSTDSDDARRQRRHRPRCSR